MGIFKRKAPSVERGPLITFDQDSRLPYFNGHLASARLAIAMEYQVLHFQRPDGTQVLTALDKGLGGSLVFKVVEDTYERAWRRLAGHLFETFTEEELREYLLDPLE